MSYDIIKTHPDIPDYHASIEAYKPKPNDLEFLIECDPEDPDACEFRIMSMRYARYGTLRSAKEVASALRQGHKDGYNRRVREEEDFRNRKIQL